MNTPTDSRKDGGQAFPHGDPTHGGELGMTLRDAFAIAAMPHFFGTGNPESRAAACYAEADWMLAARSKP